MSRSTRGSRRKVALWFLFFVSLIACATPGAALAAPSSKVLILAGTVTGGDSSIEASEAKAQGMTVDVVSGSTWASMTPAQFASYRAIILGDPTCQSLGNDQQAAANNATTWGPQINGNIVILGTDPVYHASQGGETDICKDVGYKFLETSRPQLQCAIRPKCNRSTELRQR
jgi:hypothetical protein